METRKIAVIARWCISTMYTERILQKRLQSMLGDGYNLEVNIQQKTVSVTLQLKHYKNRKIIWEMLEGIVPLDQIIDVIIIYNTYRAYKPFTYNYGNMDEIAEAVRGVANLWSIPVADQHAKSGINSATSSIYLSDNVHPNDEGGKKVANVWVNALKSNAELIN